MNWPFRFRPALTSAACAIALSACGDSGQTGNLSINYEFGPGLTCADEGVERIRVTLGNDQFDEEDDCSVENGIDLNGVGAGNYTVLVEGLDAVGDTVFDNLAPPTTDESVEVLGGSSRELDVTLGPTPAKLEFRYNIQTDDCFSIPQCTAAEPQTFVISAFFSSQVLYSETVQYCEVDPAFNALLDPDRDITGDLLNAVRIEVQDAAGTEIEQLDFNFPEPGPGKLLQFIVFCKGSDCSMSTLDTPVGTTTGADSGSGESGGATGTG